MPRRVKFPSGSTDVAGDECRLLILKIVEQAVRDFLALEGALSLMEHEAYETACAFLFDDNYVIDFGGNDKNLRDLIAILDLDVDWVRQRAVRLKRKQAATRRAHRPC